MIQKVGDEFLGRDIEEEELSESSKNNNNKNIIIFPKLKSLKFEDLGEWEEWIGMGGTIEEAPEVTNAEDSDEEDSSIRTFTNMQNNTSIKTENSDGTKDGGAQGTGPAGPTALAESSVPRIVVKEDATKIFTENIQTSGAFIAPEKKV
ncbi:hypothetical protein CFP56_023374 [Quercus suber]|uniref:Uncharacterized protein n=1 Tax=Quercus suber TaxID=58331 RepID=A0AAW0K9B1_QUESU